MALEQHPIFKKYVPWNGEVEPGFITNFLGVRTRLEFWPKEWYAHLNPGFNEEYFEWIDVLESVAEAHDEFTMLELGAGYDRWLVNAAVALRQSNPSASPYLIGVEAEPTHFEWMEMHFRDNDLDPKQHLLIQGAVTSKDGIIHFLTGYSREWYGQSIVSHPWTVFWRWRRSLHDYPDAEVKKVQSVSLKTLLHPLRYVDLIDLDVQGAEYDVLKAAIVQVNEKVRRVHIETHAKKIDRVLREMFLSMGWKNINDYSLQSKSETAYGEISFQGGLQTWVNPKLR